MLALNQSHGAQPGGAPMWGVSSARLSSAEQAEDGGQGMARMGEREQEGIPVVTLGMGCAYVWYILTRYTHKYLIYKK